MKASELRSPRGPEPAPEGRPAKADLTGVSILVVDDEADARHLLERVLTASGATVKVAPSPAVALEYLEANKVDVLISDIGMPGEDGYVLIERVRKRSVQHGGKIPAIALTAFARSEDRARAVERGFDLHLAKPVDPAELVAVVARLARPAAE